MDIILEFTEAEETLIKHYAEEKGRPLKTSCGKPFFPA